MRRRHQPELSAARQALAPFALDTAYFDFEERFGEPAGAKYVSLLTAAEDALDEIGDVVPAVEFLDFLDAQHLPTPGDVIEVTVAARRALHHDATLISLATAWPDEESVAALRAWLVSLQSERQALAELVNGKLPRQVMMDWIEERGGERRWALAINRACR